jgi:acyl-CoA thioesterase-1
MKRKKLPSAIGMACREFIVALGLLVGSIGVITSSPTAAAENLIVAFGASQTYGKGVSRDEAYPAQLEQLLRLKGYNVRVVNSGVNGQTTSAMLQRLDNSVPAGTSLVIFQQAAMTSVKVLATSGQRISRRFVSAFRLAAYP